MLYDEWLRKMFDTMSCPDVIYSNKQGCMYSLTSKLRVDWEVICIDVCKHTLFWAPMYTFYTVGIAVLNLQWYIIFWSPIPPSRLSYFADAAELDPSLYAVSNVCSKTVQKCNEESTENFSSFIYSIALSICIYSHLQISLQNLNNTHLLMKLLRAAAAELHISFQF